MDGWIRLLFYNMKCPENKETKLNIHELKSNKWNVTSGCIQQSQTITFPAEVITNGAIFPSESLQHVSIIFDTLEV